MRYYHFETQTVHIQIDSGKTFADLTCYKVASHLHRVLEIRHSCIEYSNFLEVVGWSLDIGTPGTVAHDFEGFVKTMLKYGFHYSPSECEILQNAAIWMMDVAQRGKRANSSFTCCNLNRGYNVTFSCRFRTSRDPSRPVKADDCVSTVRDRLTRQMDKERDLWRTAFAQKFGPSQEKCWEIPYPFVDKT